MTNCPTCVGIGCNECCHTGRAEHMVVGHVPPFTSQDTDMSDVSQIRDVRERHLSVYQKYNDTTICTLCRFPYPCDAIQQADALDQHLQRCREHDTKVKAERNAARADADRLAEEMRIMHYSDCAMLNTPYFHGEQDDCDCDREALQRHDALGDMGGAYCADLAVAMEQGAQQERERLRAELNYHAGEHQCRITELLLADPEARR